MIRVEDELHIMRQALETIASQEFLSRSEMPEIAKDALNKIKLINLAGAETIQHKDGFSVARDQNGAYWFTHDGESIWSPVESVTFDKVDIDRFQQEIDRKNAVFQQIYDQCKSVTRYLETLDVSLNSDLNLAGIVLAGISMTAGTEVSGKDLWSEEIQSAMNEIVNEFEEKTPPSVPAFDLKTLWDGTEVFMQRFDLNAENVPPDKRLKTVGEEVSEFHAAVLEMFFVGNSGDGMMVNAASEAADVMVTVFNTLQSLGIPWELFLAQAEAVFLKNQAKTPETHHLVDGKITKRVPKGG